MKILFKALRKLRLINCNKSHDLLGLLRISFTASISINGKKLKIPVINKIGCHNLFLGESWNNMVFKKLFTEKDGSFIDLGGNIGQTLLVVKSIKPFIDYYLFEPNPSCIYYLNKLIDRNKFQNVKVFPVGISDETDIKEFFYYLDSPVDKSASIISNFRINKKIYRTEYVSVFKLSDIQPLKKIPKIGFIKIDIEGSELEALKGSADIILKHRPFILIEILPVYSEENIDRRERLFEIEKIIKEISYRIIRVDKSPKDHFNGYTLLNEIGIHSDIHNIDYLLIPSEEVDLFS